jgi:hypothetical protein
MGKNVRFFDIFFEKMTICDEAFITAHIYNNRTALKPLSNRSRFSKPLFSRSQWRPPSWLA